MFKTRTKTDSALVPGRIELQEAYSSLKNKFDVKYEPEIIASLFVRIGGITFSIWASGKIVVFGKQSIKRENIVFNEFYKKELHFFLKKR